jgi:hypothetical protein
MYALFADFATRGAKPTTSENRGVLPGESPKAIAYSHLIFNRLGLKRPQFVKKLLNLSKL